MNGPVRFIIAFVLACAVSAMLFLMMYRLINNDDAYVVKETPILVDISKVKAPEKKQKLKQESKKTEPKV